MKSLISELVRVGSVRLPSNWSNGFLNAVVRDNRWNTASGIHSQALLFRITKLLIAL